tara:strand:+ start:2298 stop:3542 length:1245 start_codon:yes stop_codon:yes gene_type:complete
MELPKNITRQEKRRLRRWYANVGKVSPDASHSATGGLTIADLDTYQEAAFRDICIWWNTQQTIGGVAKPLTMGGVGGSGKTLTIALTLPTLKDASNNPVVVKYAAYTGKAAMVMQNRGLPASTIHSLIYDSQTKGERVIFTLKPRSEIYAELLVIDEASMIPDDMREDLESLRIPILYVGDHAQLEPVSGAGCIMTNPQIKLEEVHRQALDSGIIKVATDVRNSIPVPKGSYGVRSDAHKVGRDAVNDLNLLSNADVVICHTNIQRQELNHSIRTFKGYEGTYPQVGEKLICVRNNKDMGVCNGLAVTVVDIVYEGGYLVMDCIDEAGVQHNRLKVSTQYFDEGEHPHIKGKTNITLFEFAYAITCHKAQGSTYGDVVVIEGNMAGQKMEFRRRWLYTAISRASDSLTWISKFR